MNLGIGILRAPTAKDKTHWEAEGHDHSSMEELVKERKPGRAVGSLYPFSLRKLTMKESWKKYCNIFAIFSS
jgi:hypothetical protein